MSWSIDKLQIEKTSKAYKKKCIDEETWMVNKWENKLNITSNMINEH